MMDSRMAKQLWLCLFIFMISLLTYVNASASTSNVWIVYDSSKQPCIRMESTISLSLNYLAGPDDPMKTATVSLPAALTVNNNQSSCSQQLTFSNKVIDSQILHLDFPKDDPSWTGWSIEFYFSQSKLFHASDSEFALYGVQVVANYSSQNSTFPGHTEITHKYTQDIIFDDLSEDTSPSEIADNIYANKHYSYFCSSAAQYPINSDEHYGLLASITLKNIRVQAYAPSGNTKFGDREICPQDQTSDDLVPVIVGGVLASLVVVTLVIYLVYRARQPPSVLYLTNPHSHFEDIGGPMKHGHGEEDEESVTVVGSQRRVARHLQEHSNYAYED